MASRAYEIIDLTEDNIEELGMLCMKTRKKSDGYQNKLKWLKGRYEEGLKYKLLMVDEGKEDLVSRGFIETIPGKYAWRGVDATGYNFIHCIWVIGRHKNQGYGRKLLQACIRDSKGLNGVAVLTSNKGHWLSKAPLFLNNGFEKVDASASNFELYAYKNTKSAPDPSINPVTQKAIRNYGSGVTVLTVDHCPYIPDAVKIFQQGAEELNLEFQHIKLESAEQVQHNGICPNGTFVVLYNGQVVTYKYEKLDKFKKTMNALLKR